MITFPYTKPLYSKRTPIEAVEEAYKVVEKLGIPREEVMVKGIEVLVEPVEVEKTGTRKPEYKAKIALMKWFGEEWLSKHQGKLIMPGEQSSISLKLGSINIFLNPTKEYSESKLAVLVVLRWRIALTLNDRNGLVEIDEWEDTITKKIEPLSKEEVEEIAVNTARKLDQWFEEKLGGRKVVERAVDQVIDELIGGEDTSKEEYKIHIIGKEKHYHVIVESKYYDIALKINKYTGKTDIIRRRIKTSSLEELLSNTLGSPIESLIILREENKGETLHIVASTTTKLYKVIVGAEGVISIEKYRGLNEVVEKVKEEAEKKGLKGVELKLAKWSIESEKPLHLLVELEGIGVKVKALVGVEDNKVLSLDIDVGEEAVKKILEDHGLKVTSIRKAGSSYIAAATDGVRNYVYLVDHPLIVQLRRIELSRRYALEKSLKLLAKLGFSKPRLKTIEEDDNGGLILTWIIGAVTIDIHALIDGSIRVTGYSYDQRIIENLVEYTLKYNGIRNYNILGIKNRNARYAEALIHSSRGPLRLLVDLEELKVKPA